MKAEPWAPHLGQWGRFALELRADPGEWHVAGDFPAYRAYGSVRAQLKAAGCEVTTRVVVPGGPKNGRGERLPREVRVFARWPAASQTSSESLR